MSVNVIKSPADKKEYRWVVLESKLTCLLISDPEMNALPSAASASNGQGSSANANGKRGRSGDVEENSAELEGGDEDEEDEGEDDEGEDDEGEDDEDEEGESGDEDGDGKKGSAGPTKKAAAAMAVGAGSFSDPQDLPGLSHYLEHMLFMGSTKYPSENDYDDFLTKHGGSSNAFTELEMTNYHFDVAPDALHGALDRFAQFFLSPLCLEGSLEREVMAVDSEFSGVMQEDGCRQSQLVSHTAKPGHIYNRFTWGNKKSLWDDPRAAGIDVRERVLAYYKQQYCAERMSLVVLGGESLDALQAMVSEAFTGLPTGLGPRPSFAGIGPPFQSRTMHVVPAVKDLHEVTITFTLPSMIGLYAKKADQYISHLVGHEGPGSLLSALKSRGWATGVTAGVDEDGFSSNTCCYLFSVGLTLTEAGLAEGAGCGLAVVDLVFQYLAMMRAEGPQEWVWQEMKAIADMRFKFQEEEDAMEHALVAETLHQTWDPALVEQLMGSMDPVRGSYRLDVITRDYAKLREQLTAATGPLSEGRASVMTEPWFNMEAVSVTIPEGIVQGWATSPALPELHLPPRNPYIPTDFSIKASAAASTANGSPAEPTTDAALPEGVIATPPTFLLEDAGLRLWHKQDTTFRCPRTLAHFRLSSQPLHASPRSAALTHMTVKLLEDALNEDTYLADVAGLHFGISSEGVAGLEVRVEGFSHKLPVLTARVFSRLVDGSYDAQAFANVKEELTRKYRNMNMTVSRHANYNRLYSLCTHSWHCDAILPQLELLQPGDIAPFVASILAACHVEALLHGNMTADEGVALASQVCTILGPGCKLAASARESECCIELPAGPPLVMTQTAKNAEEENSAIEMYFQCGPATHPSDRALLDLVSQILYEPLFSTLRTKQQLGYAVHSGPRLTHGVSGFCVTIVSAKHAADFLVAAVETFLTECESTVVKMSREEFEGLKASLVGSKMQKDRALADECGRHWEQISSQRYEFHSKETEVAALAGVSKSDVLAWLRRWLLPSSKTRRLLRVQVNAPKATPAAEPMETDAKEAGGKKPAKGAKKAAAPKAPKKKALVVIDDIDKWKKSAKVFPSLLMPQPVIASAAV
ncbi:MAG: hypothetical protein WDW38_002287 [Sanguina aurantia]